MLTRTQVIAMLLAVTAFAPLAVASSTTIPIDVQATYLITNQDPNAKPATPISLSSLGVKEGDKIQLQSVGTLSFCITSDCPQIQTSLRALFSTTSDPSTALSTADGTHFPEPPTLFGNIPTDVGFVLNDFFVFASPDATTVTVPKGANFLFVIVPDSFYSDNVGSVQVVINGCKVADLSPIAQDAQEFEDAAPGAPPASLIPDQVSTPLDAAATLFEFSSPGRTRTSGFRPLSYQRHLYELRTRLADYNRITTANPDQISVCADLKNKIDEEIDHKHGIVRGIGGLPKVNPPSLSSHTSPPATALDYNTRNLSSAQRAVVDLAARLHGLYRPCSTDVVHFTLRGTGCIRNSVSITAQSPVDIIVTDPKGNRVGFDTQSHLEVNEIPDAYYSGAGTEPQFVDIPAPFPGEYRLLATGSAQGQYTLTMETKDEDAEATDTESQTGVVQPGQTIAMSLVVRKAIEIHIDDDEDQESFDPSSGRPIKVTIVSSLLFDPGDEINESSLTFGRTGTEQSLINCTQKQRAGLPQDLECRFKTRVANIDPTTPMVILRATLKDGTPIEGSDTIAVGSDQKE